jgi:hypothetical protein
MGMTYRVHRMPARERSGIAWGRDLWENVPGALVANFRPESSSHRPVTTLQMLHDERTLYGLFTVRDQYVRCLTTEFQGPVWKDSCVELFTQPLPERGYINFEFNCGGTFLCHYREDPALGAGGRALRRQLSPDDQHRVAVFHTLPALVDPEIAEPVEWQLGFAIPRALIEGLVGALCPVSGREWRANFYKCGDGTSHPHWAAWSPVDELNFHLPRCFGTILFE